MAARRIALAACALALMALEAWSDAEPAPDSDFARVRADTKKALRLIRDYFAQLETPHPRAS